jgi:4-amino-4-deoxy-L-arabinose transferase-like glycosyltransferase
MRARSFWRFFTRTALGSTILVCVLSLLFRLAFTAGYVGWDHIRHGAQTELAEPTSVEVAGHLTLETSILRGYIEGNRPRAIIDPDGYAALGMLLISDEPYRDTWRQPLYPAFNAMVFLVFGAHPALLYNRLGGIMLSVLTSALIYLLGRKMLGQTAGLVAGLISCVHFNLIHKSGYIYSELLAVPLTVLALYFFLLFTDDQKWRSLFLGAVMLGLATLTRITTFYFIFLLPIWLWVLFRRINRRMVVRSAVVVLVPLLLLAPWSVYLSSVMGHFKVVAGRPWQLLACCYAPSQFERPLGRNAGLCDMIYNSGHFTEEEWSKLEAGSIDELQRACKERVLEYLPKIWWRIPELMVYRMLVFIGIDSRGGAYRLYEAQQILLFALFVGGVWITRRLWRRFFVLHLAYFYLGIFMIVVFYGGSRMRLYVDPLIIIYAAAFLIYLWERFVLGRRASALPVRPIPKPTPPSGQ